MLIDMHAHVIPQEIPALPKRVGFGPDFLAMPRENPVGVAGPFPEGPGEDPRAELPCVPRKRPQRRLRRAA